MSELFDSLSKGLMEAIETEKKKRDEAIENEKKEKVGKERMDQRTAEAEAVIRRYLPAAKVHNATLVEAMRYSVEAGGKRLRPIILKAAYDMYGGKETAAEPFMAALEMIHTYSLVHDDLPEMDNDDLRRGKPTTHRQYGQAMAVLAGDGLLNYAFEIMTDACLKIGEQKKQRRAVQAMYIIAKYAGIYGMIGGQGLDVEAEKKDLTLGGAEIDYINENKTSKLLRAAFLAGAILAGAEEKALAQLDRIGYLVGVAFQLQDDILDVTATTEEIGKTSGSDLRNGKKTYLSIHGLEVTKEVVYRMSLEAEEIMENIEAKDTKAKEFLCYLIRKLMDRKN